MSVHVDVKVYLISIRENLEVKRQCTAGALSIVGGLPNGPSDGAPIAVILGTAGTQIDPNAEPTTAPNKHRFGFVEIGHSKHLSGLGIGPASAGPVVAVVLVKTSSKRTQESNSGQVTPDVTSRPSPPIITAVIL